MIFVSQLAQDHFLNLLKNQETETNIRIYVKYPGTPVAKCGVSYCYKKDVTDSDVLFKMKNFSIYIQKLHLPYLKKLKLDMCIEEDNSCQLTLVAPYANKCSFINDLKLKNRVNNFLNTSINSQLAVHGGSVKLVNITKSGYASLQFFGGCNGCSMIGKTLKDGIEKQIVVIFSELKGVYDVTQHDHGNHSYY